MLREYVEELNRLQNQKFEVLACLKKQFDDLPQDVGVRRLGENCFVMNFSQLSEVWTPEYYDFRLAYKILLKIFERTKPENLLKKWETIKASGFSWDEVCKFRNELNVTKYVNAKLNPKMIALVDKLMYE